MMGSRSFRPCTHSHRDHGQRYQRCKDARITQIGVRGSLLAPQEAVGALASVTEVAVLAASPRNAALRPNVSPTG